MLRKILSHSTTVLIGTLCLLFFGWSSYRELPREAAPDIPVPVVMVSTPYVGVSPGDIEALITIPLERELATVQDVKKMSSTSAEGVSIIAIEFEPDVAMEEAIQSIRDRVGRAKPFLPSDAEEPEVREISFSDIPILIVTMSGASEQELKILAEKLQEEVGRISGVLEAQVSGGLTREIRVQVDPVRLAYYGIGLNDIIGAIQSENVNIPGGEIAVGRGSFLVRVPGEFSSAVEIEQVPVKRVGDVPVLVSDLARVIDGFRDRETYARMNSEPAISLSVTKRTGANIVGVAAEVKALTAEHETGWPDGVSYRVLADQSEMISDMVSELQNNILTALLLVVGVIFTFLGFRTSLFVAFAIPLSMLTSLILIQALGFTLNMIVLFSLILALGMLVDNAIVVVENIYRHMEEGKSAKEAALEGTNEVAWAVAASTATTVAAFFPLIFWGGIMGEFMGYLPKTLIIVLFSSLMVAVVILPVLTAKFLRPKAQRKVFEASGERILGPWLTRYKAVLEWSIDHRYRSAGGGFGLLIFTFICYGFLNHGTEFFPDTEPDRAIVAVEAPDGTDIETTDRLLREVEVILRNDPNVDVFVSESGVSGGGDPLAGSQRVPNHGRITVDFLPGSNRVQPGQRERVESTRETIKRLRLGVSKLVGADISVDKEEMGPPVGAPIAVEVSGEDFHKVGEIAAAFQREIAAVAGVTELSNNYRVGRPEMRIRIDRAAAKLVGVNSTTIGNTIRTAVAGAKASTLRDGEDEYDIIVEVAPAFRENLQDVLELRVPGRNDMSPDTFPVPLSTVAQYELAGGTGSIHHIDQDLVVTIQGDVKTDFNQNAVRAEVQLLIDKAETPEGYHIAMGGADDEQRQAQAFLSRAFSIALVLILLVLVTQFDSLAVPAIILASVVLSLVGVLWGLILTGTSFGIIMTGIGVISLAGVVVNNAIVLLDYVEQLRDRGLDTRDALIEGGLVRFRPVMLTAATTILGLMPMALGISIDFSNFRLVLGGSTAEWWGPMAVAVIFGLAFATVLTLVMVPTLYSISEELKGKMGWTRVTQIKGVPIMVIEAPDPVGMEESRKYAGDMAKVEALAADLLGSLGRRKNSGGSDDETDGGGK
jgi:multidrug efflux pump subunit AcrB